MTGVLIAFAITLLVPLFVGKWRTSLVGLSMQGALMASIAARRDLEPSIDAAITFVDLIVVRTIAVPLALHLVLRRQKAPPRNEVLAPNLFSWALAFALVVVAFRAADVLAPTEGDEQMLIAVSAAALLLGLLVLSTANRTISQIIGVLRVDNAIALFELGSRAHEEPIGIRIGKVTLVVASLAFYRWYLAHVAQEDSPPTAPGSGVL